jgi:hypothetical protein
MEAPMLKRRIWMEAMEAKGFSFRKIDNINKTTWRGIVYAPDGALLTSCIVLTTDAGTPHEGVTVFWCGESNRTEADAEYLQGLVAARAQVAA